MAENSKIEWTKHTWNPWIGCTEVSPACDNCYARAQNNHRKWAEGWGAGVPRHRTSAAKWKEPYKWNREAAATGERPLVFCASLADWQDSEVSDAWKNDLERVVDDTPNLDWLLLSKRHNNVLKFARERKVKPNVRLGMTVENEEWAKARLPFLGGAAMRGWKTFVSYEPALGPVNWDLYLDRNRLFGGVVQWLIVGGESAKGVHRPFDLAWAYAARDACRRNGVPFFMKQIDKKTPIPDDLMIREFPSAHATPAPQVGNHAEASLLR